MIARAPALADGTPVFQFTLDQYHRMIELGILGPTPPREFIDGVILRKVDCETAEQREAQERLLGGRSPMFLLFGGYEDVPVPWFPLSVDQYHRMIDEGVISSGPYELLDGLIVHKNRSAAGEDPMTAGDEHSWVIVRLTRLEARFAPLGCHLRIQLPIMIPPSREPEPDAAFVEGVEDDYLGRKPTSEQIPCVLEVSDSSLAVDRGRKLEMYAEAGIAQYIIVNLVDRVVEVYRNLQAASAAYDPPLILRGEQILHISAGHGRSVEVSASYLLPPTAK